MDWKEARKNKMTCLGKKLFHRYEGYIGEIVDMSQLPDAIHCTIKCDDGQMEYRTIPNNNSFYYIKTW